MHKAVCDKADTNSPGLDKIRSYARRAAWYDDEGEHTHNPFKKIRVNRRRKQHARDLERGGLARGGIEGKQLTENTFQQEKSKDDADMSATGQTGDRDSQEKDAPTLAGSEDAINVSRDIDGEESGPRRRKTGLSNPPTEADDTASSASSGKPVFTVASQLRATILNSWINLLLVLVPVGSTFDPTVFANQQLIAYSCSELYQRQPNSCFCCELSCHCVS